MKIVILDGYTENPGDLNWDGFSTFGEVMCYERTAPHEVIPRCKDANILLVNKVKIDRDTMKANPQLRYIGVLATGYDVVDVQAAKELGITVTNIPGYGTATVAQYAMALLLELCSHVGHHARRVKAGEWAHNIDWCFWDYPLIELAGKTMGIIGYGRIGQQMGLLAHAMGMRVIFYNRHKKEETYAKQVSLQELLTGSDVISLHCPLTEENENLIRKETLALMKPNSILINNARGKLINEEDLAYALQNHQIYAAALDVVREEPIHENNPLLQCDNCLITPHISWASKEARQRIMDCAIENLSCFLQGNVKNSVI